MDWTEINGFSFHLKKKANFMPWYYSFSLLKKKRKKKKINAMPMMLSK